MRKIYVGQKEVTTDLHLFPGENLYTGEKPFAEKFGELDSLEVDILTVASGIYAADLSCLRSEREQNIRSIEISIEVVNKHLFDNIKNQLTAALIVLSKDNWKIEFVKAKGILIDEPNLHDAKQGAVLLFSGGLDSMCAASEFMRRNEEVVLVSHNTQGNNVVDGCQSKVHKSLEEYYGKTLEHVHLKVYGRNKGERKFVEERENSQRTRSFLFLSLAALVMKRKNFSKILFMAENGQFAIHLPLNQARVGPFSTHTADPEFLEIAQEIFAELFGNPIFSIENPFLYKTKAEVVAVMPKKLLEASIGSGSCWKMARTIKHCGECIPCISRRISIEYNGTAFNEYISDIFKKDISKLAEDHTGKRNLIDYLEFITKFKDISEPAKSELTFEFPELFNSAIDQEKAIQMYHRMAIQSFEVIKRYPKLKPYYDA